MKQLISIEDILKRSWKSFVTQWKPALKFLLPALFIPFLGTFPFILTMRTERLQILGIILLVITVLASMYFGVAFTKYFVHHVFNEKKSPWPNVSEYFGSLVISLLYGIITIIGFLLFILPGIWLGMLFAFSLPIYLHDDIGVFEAMKRSWQIVQGRWWAAFIRILLPNLLWQIGVGAIMYGSMILLFALGGVWFAILGSAETSLAAETMRTLNIVGGIVGIAAIIGVFALQIVASFAAGIAQLSIMIETYKSLENTHK